MNIKKRILNETNKVYIFRDPIDMRRQIDGLVAIIEGSFELDPFDKSLFVFCNKRKDKIKAVHWSGDGFELYYKRMEKGKFQYPFDFDSESSKISISENDFNRLVHGLVLEQFVLHKKHVIM